MTKTEFAPETQNDALPITPLPAHLIEGPSGDATTDRLWEEAEATWEADNLQVFPRSPDYRQLPVEEAFDWNAIISRARAQRTLGTAALYLVVFASTLKPGVDTTPLHEHDRRAHEAALEEPSLIHYFADEANEAGEALSFCLWEDAGAAKRASRDPRHTAAMKMVELYRGYKVDMFNVHHTEDPVRLELVHTVSHGQS